MTGDMFDDLQPGAPKPEPKTTPKPEAGLEIPVVFGAQNPAPAPDPAPIPVSEPPPASTPTSPPFNEPPQSPPPVATRVRTSKAKSRPSSFLSTLPRRIAIIAAAFLGFSVLWVLAYRVLPIPGTFLMIQRAIEGQNVRRTPVPITKISPHLVRAVIAAEDSKFCKHGGFDFDAINLAMEEAEAGERLRGASTISQQTSKNVFLWQGRGFIRKGLEVYFTFLTETMWPKFRIMEAYLNSIEFGRGYFGAEAAARGYFGKSARKLTAREAAALAAILPSPNKWRAVKPGKYVARRIGTLQKRMAIVRRDGLDDCVYARPEKVK